MPGFVFLLNAHLQEVLSPLLGCKPASVKFSLMKERERLIGVGDSTENVENKYYDSGKSVSELNNYANENHTPVP